MSRQSFSEKNLETVLKYRKKQSRIIFNKESKLTFSEIESKVNDNNYKIGCFSSFRINNDDIYQAELRDDDIVISKLDYNIRSIYRVKQKDRHTIVKQILSMLKEHTPKYIYRLDIKRFYESVDLDVVSNKLVNDNILSSQSEFVLLEYSKAIKEHSIQGIPRGVGLSATLSEVYMKGFDRRISNSEFVTYYTRFVDDILIMSSKRLNIKDEVISHLPIGLTLNWKKTKVTKVMSCYCNDNCQCNRVCDCWSKCKCHKAPSKEKFFSYLGYEFLFPEIITKNHNKNVKVGLAPSKFKKIRNRIYLSFQDYSNNGNFKLLNNRIKFLTGNHYLSRSKGRTDTIKSGVYYNYIHLDVLDKHVELDKYLKTMIKSWDSKKICLNSIHKESLNKYSFVSGFKNKNTTKFSASQLNKIKGCWNNG
ncbi:antiviral reverse transcriptase Drt3a [Vibrio splendidus]|uniref:antiviral reverse transcriptase Drt3a n=1 Tax=Vibrio splendidus TaxID=29497 RepID=UPI00076AAE5B|nr:antiviral reverse transcriptase Drt3a [Vibrio splendidus]